MTLNDLARRNGRYFVLFYQILQHYAAISEIVEVLSADVLLKMYDHSRSQSQRFNNSEKVEPASFIFVHSVPTASVQSKLSGPA